MENKSSIKEIIDNSMDQIRTIVDANTVLGTPINTPGGATIIPVSKVSIGFASGGLDLPNKNEKVKNFGGGGGTGVTLDPLAIITVSPSGEVEMLSLTPEKPTSIEQVANTLDNIPSVIERIKDILITLIPQKDEEAAVPGEDFEATLETEVIKNLTEKEYKQIQKIQTRAAKRASKEEDTEA